jgi:hypothetical protein
MTNIIVLLKKDDAFNHLGECIKKCHLGCELLYITRQGVIGTP